MRYLILVLPFILFFSACGGKNGDGQSTQNKRVQEQQPKVQNQNIRTVEIIGIDQMKYAVKEEGDQIGTGDMVKTSSGDNYWLLENITATAGENLRIRLTTKSKLPATAMSHNWILLQMGVDPAGIANAAIQAKENDFIPKSRSSDIIAHTDLSSGGNSSEIIFTVPDKTGQYDYLCSFPGHFTAGMKGKLIVQ